MLPLSQPAGNLPAGNNLADAREHDRAIMAASVRQALDAAISINEMTTWAAADVAAEIDKVSRSLMAMIDAYVERAVR
jgi:hypothetical protein